MIALPQTSRLGGTLSNEQVLALGRQLAAKASYLNIKNAVASLSPEDHQRVMLAYLAAGGDPRTFEKATAPPAPSRPKWIVPALLGTGALVVGSLVFVFLRRRS
jgi:hypothetical protein